MGDPTVSVIMCTHNSERFVGQAVDSILNQTYQSLEVIVVDNDSTDRTRRILASYCDPRLRVVHEPNLWLGFARNRGIAKSTGEYIASMSYDDVSDPDRLTIQLATMRRESLDVCFTWADIVDERGDRCEHPLRDVFNQAGRDSEQILARLQRGNFLLAPSVICHRACYDQFAWNIVLFGLQDYALWLQLLRQHRARVLELPLLRYRVHDANVSIWRFANEYRQLEVLAACHLAGDRPFPSTGIARRIAARGLLNQARRLMVNPENLADAYLAAVRAVNLDPLRRNGYGVLGAVLSTMGHHEPAEIVRAIGGRVDKSLAYPLPLVRPPSWRLLAREIAGQWLSRPKRPLKSGSRLAP